MARSIGASVGRMGGVNLAADVVTVQELLNNVPPASGGPATKLVVDGFCKQDTIDAIQRFQLRHFGWSGADGRVDPAGPTLARLNEFDTPAPRGDKPGPARVTSTQFSIRGFDNNVWHQPGGVTTRENREYFEIRDLANNRRALYEFSQARRRLPFVRKLEIEVGKSTPFRTDEALDVIEFENFARWTTVASRPRTSWLELKSIDDQLNVAVQVHKHQFLMIDSGAMTTTGFLFLQERPA